jgi:uncharacterized membrane protein YeaQ/YmgE (transglycosylase-associated protein family)
MERNMNILWLIIIGFVAGILPSSFTRDHQTSRRDSS